MSSCSFNYGAQSKYIQSVATELTKQALDNICSCMENGNEAKIREVVRTLEESWLKVQEGLKTLEKGTSLESRARHAAWRLISRRCANLEFVNQHNPNILAIYQKVVEIAGQEKAGEIRNFLILPAVVRLAELFPN